MSKYQTICRLGMTALFGRGAAVMALVERNRVSGFFGHGQHIMRI